MGAPQQLITVDQTQTPNPPPRFFSRLLNINHFVLDPIGLSSTIKHVVHPQKKIANFISDRNLCHINQSNEFHLL